METGQRTDVEKRLARLEREGKRWRAAALALLLAMGVLWTAAFAGQNDFDRGFILPPRTEGIRARAFLLTDRNGKVQGEWRMEAGQPVFKLYSQDGKVLWFAPPRAGFKPVEVK